MRFKTLRGWISCLSEHGPGCTTCKQCPHCHERFAVMGNHVEKCPKNPSRKLPL
jgi:hypothetical protein